MEEKTFNIMDIESPKFIKQLNNHELVTLCSEIRKFIIENVSKTGGHLSSNLGAVEAIVAMHYVFDSPRDKFLFDVSHQAYTHKILTGRAKDFEKLRCKDGLSGFTSYEESEHDVWVSGHSSNTISAAAGFLEAKEINDSIGEILVFIGDGSIQNGVAFEGLNYIGSQKNQKLIVIVNDNDMSISKNVGRLARRFSKMRIKKSYRLFKGIFPGFVKKGLSRVTAGIRSFVYGGNIFNAMGYRYYGPIDGNNIKEMITYLKFAKDSKESVILHINTKKGLGFDPALNDNEGIWHGVGKFNKDTGEIYKNNEDGFISWSEAISNILDEEIKNNPNIRLICPATLEGSNIRILKNKYPNQVIDVGINEEHALVMAASMARNGIIPIVSIYSTFLQRAYDFLNNDITRDNNHVIFLVDRAGIVPNDGSTHQGIFDVSMMVPLPNMVISMPKDMEEASNLIKYAIKHDGPFTIRYPKESVKITEIKDKNLEFGKWKIINDIKEINFITYGPILNDLYEQIDKTKFGLINALFIKPIDLDCLMQLKNKTLIVIEEVITQASLYTLILDANAKYDLNIKIKNVGIDDYIKSLGTRCEIKEELSIDIASIINKYN